MRRRCIEEEGRMERSNPILEGLQQDEASPSRNQSAMLPRGDYVADYLHRGTVAAVTPMNVRKGSNALEHTSTKAAEAPNGVPGFHFAPVDGLTYANADYHLRWLVKRLLVADLPVIIGGPKKALKTTLLIDLALALASGHAFLGCFDVNRPVKTVLLSGESGEWAIQETARRIALSKGLELGTTDCHWQFALPQLSNALHMEELRRGLPRLEAKVVIVNPLYLSLLSGKTDLKASNLFDIGPLLLNVARACLNTGCTPILAHHTDKRLARPFDPLDLDDLSFAGFAEFARAWLLINRREPFDPGTGCHKLWLCAGGSCGQGGLWAVDVDEGILCDDLSGRQWKVAVTPADEARADRSRKRSEEKERRRLEQIREDGEELLLALDKFAGPNGIAGQRIIRQSLRWGEERLCRVVAALVADDDVEETNMERHSGPNHSTRQLVRGLRRKPPEG
jgi:hypothetical protein